MAPPIGAGPFFKGYKMFQLELAWDPFKPDIKRYDRALKSNMRKLWQDAIAEFVRTIVYDDLVKVDTGMSAASLYDAAAQARIWGEISSVIVFKRKRAARKGLTSIDGTYYKNRFRTLKEGQAVAERATKISFKLPTMEFNFDIQVFQWWYWETYKGYWNALNEGADAFIRFIDNNWEDYIPGLEHLFK